MRYLTLILCSLILTACERGSSPVNQWEFSKQGAYSASLSRSGQYMTIGSIHHGGSLWQFSQHERVYDWNHKEGESSNILSSAFSPNESHVVTADHRTLVIWNAKTGAPGWFWNAPGDINAMKLTRDGQFALLGMDDYTAAFFDIQNGGVKQTLNHQGVVEAVALSDDGQLALTGSDDQSAKIWDLQTGKLLQTLPHENQVKMVSLSHDGSMAFTSALRGRATIWDTRSGKVISEIPRIRGNYRSARFSDDGKELLTGSSVGYIQVWDIRTGKEKSTGFATPRNRWISNNVSILDVAFGKGNKLYAIASNGLGYEFSR